MVGGLIRLVMDKLRRSDDEKKAITNDGVLFCSGMIAGEGLVGIVLALLAVFGIDSVFDLSSKFGIAAWISDIGGIVLFALIILTVLKFSLWKKRDNK
jgi:integral membrane sensor domain MASE1